MLEEKPMGDFYTEQLIKKHTDAKDMGIKIALIAATAVCFVAAFFLPFLIILPVLAIVGDVIMFRRLDVEYEYIFINGDLDIDKVMHKEKRKNLLSVNVKDLELLAPEGADQLNNFRAAKAYDYSSGDCTAANRYVLVMNRSGVLTKVTFEPGNDLVEGFYLMAPRKVLRR